MLGDVEAVVFIGLVEAKAAAKDSGHVQEDERADDRDPPRQGDGGELMDDLLPVAFDRTAAGGG